MTVSRDSCPLGSPSRHHLPSDKLMALSGSTSSPPRVKSRGKVEGRRIAAYASLLGLRRLASDALLAIRNCAQPASGLGLEK
jgi:hypothetical protein